MPTEIVNTYPISLRWSDIAPIIAPSCMMWSTALTERHEKACDDVREDARYQLMALKMNLEISKDSQKTRVLDESTPEEKTFLEKHGAFLGNLSDIAGIPKNRFLALIERETSFRPNNNGKGSFGYGQLTKIIFEDMKYVIPLGKEKNTTGRGEKYANLFLRCAEGNDITGVVTSLNNLEAKNAMERLLSCMKDGKINPKQKGLYNQTIQELARLARKDDQINLLFSAILHGRMHADISQAVEKANSWIPKAREAMERWFARLDNTFLQRLVLQGWKPSVEASREVAQRMQSILTEIKDPTSPTLTDFLALYQYNGNRHEESGKLPHQFYYALAVMIKERIRDGVAV